LFKKNNEVVKLKRIISGFKMLNKSVLFLLMFSLIFSSIFNTTARAESKKLFEKHNIQVVSDTDELKEIRVNSLTENSTYIVKIQNKMKGIIFGLLRLALNKKYSMKIV
jgi:hypothetical protein